MGHKEQHEHNPPRGTEETGPGSSQGAWRGEINRHKNGREVSTGLRRNVLTVRTVKYQLPREVVWSPSLALLPAGGWSRDPEVPSNLNYPLILQHPVQEGQEEPCERSLLTHLT